MRFLFLYLAACVLMFATPQLGYADGYAAYYGVYQHDQVIYLDRFEQIPDGGIYNREEYDYVSTFIDLYFSSDQGYEPDFGRQWQSEQFRATDEQSTGIITWEVRESSQYDFCIYNRVEAEGVDDSWKLVMCQYEP